MSEKMTILVQVIKQVSLLASMFGLAFVVRNELTPGDGLFWIPIALFTVFVTMDNILTF